MTSIRAKVAEYVEILKEVYPCEFRVLNYYVGHQRLIMSATSLIDTEATKRMYIEFGGVHYAQFVPRWRNAPFQLLDEASSEAFLQSIGLERTKLPFVFAVESHRPSIVIVCGFIALSDTRPDSSDYHDL